ncbi:hypothetical protein [Christiangramia crocea]|uniref:DUF1574 domain-containing protein n=1 Tax=Christiangramia crocea TaxID=2904124 RepID=A0A9X1UU87_9FLAO|nr:hypothetical protein [Gramella crocea]MCG9970447.1 hypothetical protein [Gramella crocea]
MIKLFLSKVIKILLPILLLMGVLEVALRRIPNDYSIKYSHLNNNAGKLKTLVLGSSHFYRGVDPSKLPQPAYNAAMFSQSIDYDYKVLVKFEDELDNLENIILPISYFSLFTNLETGIEFWREKDYNIYYELGEFHSLELSKRNGFQNLIRVYNYYLKGESYVQVNELGWGKKSGVASRYELIESGVQAAERHTANNFDLLSDQLNYLKKIIDMAEKNQWKLYLITPPGYTTYTSRLSDRQLNKTLEISKKFDDKFGFVYYKNFLKADFLNASDYFDADHLNENGAEKFSNAVNSFLIENN